MRTGDLFGRVGTPAGGAANIDSLDRRGLAQRCPGRTNLHLRHDKGGREE